MQSLAQGGIRGHRAAGPGAVNPGLVPTKTSHTHPGVITVDRRASRLRRMKRSVITRARCMTEGCQRGGHRFRVGFITLTYRDVVAWAPGHFAAFSKRVRSYLERLGHVYRYVFVAELQQRGAVHYHVCVWLPKGLTLPKPDKRGWWPHGSTRIEWARSPVGYLAKYASKGDAAAQLPPGLRLTGAGGLDQTGRVEAAWWLTPAYVREAFPEPSHRPARAHGGGWLSRLTGELIPSPWALLQRSADWSWSIWVRKDVVGIA